MSRLIEFVFMKEFEQSTTNPNMIARIYSLKFLSTFRLQIPQNSLNFTINMLVDIMKKSDNVTMTACLLTLEKVLFMRDLHTNASLVKDAVNDQNTFIGLISTLVNIVSASINIFAMRCLFRTVFLTSESYYSPIIESLSNSINDILKMIIANPSEDQFNYYLFETISLVYRKLGDVDRALYNHFDGVIKGNLIFIIENSITDLMPYAFQLFALQLSVSIDDNPLNDSFHQGLLSAILFNESNWTLQMKYMVAPFVSYIKVAIIKCKMYFLSDNNNLSQLFNIIDKLLSLKAYSHAFELLDLIINFFDYPLISNKIKLLFYNFMVINNNLKVNNKKAHKEFSKILIVFLAKLIIKTSVKDVIELIESASQGLTVNLLTELCEIIMDLDNNKNKKLVTYAYCSIMSNFYSSFDPDTLRLFTLRLIQHLERFYKVNLKSLGGDMDKLLEQGQDLSYAANNYNKLFNAEVKVEFEQYNQVYQIDENQMFFNTMNTIKNASNMNLINDVYSNMTEREKEYLQTASKNYSK